MCDVVESLLSLLPTPFWTTADAGFVIGLVPQIASSVAETSRSDMNSARFPHH